VLFLPPNDTQTVTRRVAALRKIIDHPGALRSKITPESDYLRAEIIGRETVEETAQFLKDAGAAALQHKLTRLLIVVRESRAIFKVEDYRISEYFKAMAERPGHRIALVGDSSETYAAHGYIEVLARQRGLAVRAFREEAPALEWLRSEA